MIEGDRCPSQEHYGCFHPDVPILQSPGALHLVSLCWVPGRHVPPQLLAIDEHGALQLVMLESMSAERLKEA